MNLHWFRDLEKELDKKFKAFLQANPYQAELLTNQKQKDVYNNLLVQKQKIQKKAESIRKELLALGVQIKEWSKRSQRAKEAGAKDLAFKAELHLQKLMTDGRNLWSELDQLGIQFQGIEQQVLEIAEKTCNNNSQIEQEWAGLETEEELRKLKRNKGLS